MGYWINYLNEKKRKLQEKKNKISAEFDANILKVEEQIAEAQKQIEKEIIDKYDFDCDGIFSVIDFVVVTLVSLGVINYTDPLYDKNKMTYNGKSLDINEDGKVNITDQVNVINELLQNISSEINLVRYENDINWIRNFYTENHRLPTLEEVESNCTRKN